MAPTLYIHENQYSTIHLTHIQDNAFQLLTLQLATPSLESTMIMKTWETSCSGPGVVLAGTQVACDPHGDLLGEARLQKVLLQCSSAFYGLWHSLQRGYEVCRMILPRTVLSCTAVAHCAGQRI